MQNEPVVLLLAFVEGVVGGKVLGVVVVGRNVTPVACCIQVPSWYAFLTGETFFVTILLHHPPATPGSEK